MVELLLQYKAEVSAVNPVDGFTPLMYACLLGDVRTVNRLLAVSKKREAINGDGVPTVFPLLLYFLVRLFLLFFLFDSCSACSFTLCERSIGKRKGFQTILF